VPLINLRDSISRKLTAMNLLVSGGALLLASTAFFAYDVITFRTNLATNTSIQARMIGSNAVSPLIFNDAKSAENTLSALRAAPHIVYAAIYAPNGAFFAGYSIKGPFQPLALPPFTPAQAQNSWFENGQFGLEQTIMFQGKPVGIVYIRSDLGALSDRLKSYALIFLGIMAFSLVTALALSRVLQRVISEPILRLAETARLVSRDKDYSIRAPTTGDRDEVASLVDAFNTMLLEIQAGDTALQESEQQFRTLADSIPQMAWMAGPDGGLSWYNRRWYEYTGTTPEQMAGWGWQSVQNPERLPEVLEKWRESLATGRPFEMIFPLRGADGSFREFLTLAMPVRDAHGTIVRWFGTNTDITEQRRSEEALRQTEKLAATGRLAASIAHEINNPLEAVTNLVYLAQKQPANAGKYLELADQELDRISQITKNTLGFYRDTLSPTEVDICKVLSEVHALYTRKLQFKRISFQCECPEKLTIVGFPGEIRQVFANLIANAIDALSDEGHLLVRVSRITALNGTGRPGVRITFLDNGPGIPAEHRKKIFQPFYTTKKDVGTGLGLWLTQNLVNKHRGSLRVRSSTRPGQTWTAFSVFLPEQPLTN
jgi:PAS domain S-box-containing protein